MQRSSAPRAVVLFYVLLDRLALNEVWRPFCNVFLGKDCLLFVTCAFAQFINEMSIFVFILYLGSSGKCFRGLIFVKNIPSPLGPLHFSQLEEI